MAISATCVIEVRTGGSDTNGALFNAAGSSPGTDRSMQDAAQVFIDGATITATVHTTTTQITIVGYTVSAADNRNGLQITGGTATAGFYEIVAVDVPNNRWQLDRAVGTSTQTVVGRMGGGLASPGKAAGVVSGLGCDVWVKSGNYSMTTTTANVAAGRVQTSGSSSNAQRWEGYQTTRGDRAARAVFKASGNNSFTMFTGTNNLEIVNIECDGNGQTSITGFNSTGLDRFFLCYARSCATGFGVATNTQHVACRAISCGNGFSGAGPMYACTAESCTTAGFSSNSGQMFMCIDNASAIGFNCTGNPSIVNCTAYGGSGVGFTTGNSGQATLVNCIAYGRGGVGFDVSSNRNNKLINCAGGSNGGAGNQNNSQDAIFVEGFITLTANPFTNAGSGDFSLNNTAGGGAALRETAYPTTFINTTTAQYLDVGAAQVHIAAAAAATYNTSIVSAGISL